jgi:hypothetical protein
MIYHPQLPPAVILTWIQLRGLAWGGTVTPPLRMQELTALTGKCQATIYSHMSLLRHMLALSWRSTEQGRIIVTFANEPAKNNVLISSPADIPDSSILDSKILESKNHPSLSINPSSSQNNLVNLVNNKDKDLKEKGIKKDELIREGHSEFQESGMPSRNLESDDPISIFRSLAHLTPNPAQRRLLSTKVTDLPLWQQSVEHWLQHGWNPKNITGMIDLYQHGGASGCRNCHADQKPARTVKSGHETSHEALEELRREMSLPNGSRQS